MIFPFPNVVMAEAAQMRRNTKKRRPAILSTRSATTFKFLWKSLHFKGAALTEFDFALLFSFEVAVR